MKKTAIMLATLAGLAVVAAAQSPKEIKKVEVSSTPADSGPQMFKAYCATCHGSNGKGAGPAAQALKVPPADLTVLKQNNRGKFPVAKVTHVLEGTDEITAHGSTDMPLWGPVFHSLTPSNDGVVKLRIANLTKYIESLQK